MFTLISGYLYKQRNLKELLSKYIYPMLLFSAVNFAIGYLFYDKYHEGINIIGYAMWYLWALFWFQIITPPILRIFNVKVLLVISFVAAVIYSLLPISGMPAMLANKLQINRLVGFYPFYLLGILLKTNGLLATKKMNSWRLTGLIVMALYLGCCYLVGGFAYKSGFYLSTSSSIMTIAQFLASYVFIMSICVCLIKAIPNTANQISQYGGRTLNVYLLHMVVVFPLCYGVFKQLDYSLLSVVLNSFLACLLCLLFFTKPCDLIMKRLMSKQHWGVVVVLYLLTLVLVNSSLITKFLING